MIPKPLSHEQLLLLVDDLLELEVLELIPAASDPSTLYIPYMMNDAVEYYLILRNCQVMGEVPKEFDGDTQVRLVDAPDRPGMIFDMPTGEKLTLWFDRCEAVREFYQYHRLGHFWREGAEHWRMLVYMIGTIHDKYAFLGPDAVNKAERALLPLVHFGPFRYYSPIDEPLDDRYPEGEDGWVLMRELAVEAGDSDYVRRIDYARARRRLPFFGRAAATEGLAGALVRAERRGLFAHIYRRVCEASAPYPERRYGAAVHLEMERARALTSDSLHERGFVGDYPRFVRGGTVALALEEHPFTVGELDYEGFGFRVALMVWEEGANCPAVKKYKKI